MDRMLLSHSGGPRNCCHQLRESIAYLEARLLEIGCDGDCTDEHPLSRYYDNLLLQRRGELSLLSRGIP